MSSTVIRPIQQYRSFNFHLFLIYAYIRNTCMLEHICCISLITVDKIQQDDLLKVISAIQAQLINKYKSIKEKLLNATPASILTSSV